MVSGCYTGSFYLIWKMKKELKKLNPIVKLVVQEVVVMEMIKMWCPMYDKEHRKQVAKEIFADLDKMSSKGIGRINVKELKKKYLGEK